MILFHCYFLYEKQLTTWKQVKHSIYCLCNKHVKHLLHFQFCYFMIWDFYFNIVTVVNFFTSIINAIVLTVCYRNHKDLLSGILMVVMKTMDHAKGVKALKLSDDELITTDNPVKLINSNDGNTYYSYSTLWIFLIVLLSMLTFALNWIFMLIIRPLTRKSSICQYILPCYKSHNDFILPAISRYSTCKFRQTNQSLSYNDCSPTMFFVFYWISQNF